MVYRVLVVGDPHFKGEERLNQGNKIHTDQMRSAVINTITETKPNMIVVLGDVLDRFARIHSIALTDATDWIYEMADKADGAPVYVLIGNHDRPSHDDYMSHYHPFSGIRNQENIIIVDKTKIHFCEELEGLFVFVPYVKEGRFIEAIADHLEDKIITLFAHQEFKGCNMNGIISEHGDHWPSTAPFITSGHIHMYQHVGNNILYPGTPMQHDFGDLSEKSISLLTYNGNLDIADPATVPEYAPGRYFEFPVETRISLGMKMRKRLEMTVEEIEKWNYDDNYLWKITVIGKDAEVSRFLTSPKYKKLKASGVNIFAKRISGVEQRSMQDAPKINTRNFAESLNERVSRAGNAKQKYWLDKILSEM